MQPPAEAKPLPQHALLDLEKLPERWTKPEVIAPHSFRSTENSALLPVVVLTSSDEKERYRFQLSVGVLNSYIRKPVNFSGHCRGDASARRMRGCCSINVCRLK